MRVVSCNSFGPLDQLTIEERPPRELGPADVRIEVKAAGVNFVDGLFVQGLYQVKPPLPFVPGGEIAGVVTEVGAEVSDLAVGQRVFVSTGLGGFATEVVVPAGAAVATPDAMTDGQAATFVQSYMTAWFALHVRARASAGQLLLVLGAGGGVGLAAVDVGRAMGLQVLAAASSEAKRAVAVAHGAAATLDTTADDLKTAAKEWAKAAGRSGVDLVYDPVGGSLAESALRSLDDDGQYLVIGFAAGEIPRLPANQVLLRNRRVTGVDWGGWIGKHQAENRQMLHDVLAAISAGDLHPVEPRAYAFEDVASALGDQLQRNVVGKSVLVP
ncbi:MAG: NADPH:quinone oxidoreductase family protein [Acidimicrobiaceae bacterium]|nr:NADPH:quinone oxidoreductase family protein [Ilumatobacter sp.]MCB9382130.1 NADPH:quinone oxidoreductase family protein [Acidimicrobiaceae bacterium]MCO5330884.1 NADPH:quinone oxidoreductase family protein [Ilumatobacteraceae bacterium]